MNQTVAFIIGCVLTGVLIVLLLMGWMVFGKSSPDEQMNLQIPSPLPSVTFSYSPKVTPSPLVTALPQPLPLPPPPISIPSTPNFKDYKLEQEIRNQSEQQRSAYDQLKTQLQQQLLDTRQLKTQLEQQWGEIQQLRLQQDQLRLENDRLLVQVQQQERLISGLSLQQGIDSYNRRSSNSSPSYLEKGLLWFIAGIILAVLLLGGGIILIGMIILFAQPQRRTSYNNKTTTQNINVPWEYTIHDQKPTKFLPPYIDRNKRIK
ncbi:MAG: hypothetical protein O4861_14190 [Trichodesmium sp. St16_bin4-tuft]|nr:hypothetical protein [Trichodesmium sp. MAG_R01]MDE5068050.1 hypothetical protein [Trichodesmium sp. St4_bin8_1]MDE5073448.1 hypothetical protein [Trichodesmium sp. St5_bin8]MDE5078729.1 hypothetical protein [Trichodesmium sp. St2_bin6]MDE5090859.1 hypothetical protein [Trichodesmium sp. St18_bin3_1_1]MDE5099411.1 hypothetical protein [Trichodesmium sp. St16_bin4-tuft]MDE5102796.1 hypothetical protein [Trichodesmium sp. St19_bin2]